MDLVEKSFDSSALYIKINYKIGPPFEGSRKSSFNKIINSARSSINTVTRFHHNIKVCLYPNLLRGRLRRQNYKISVRYFVLLLHL